MCTAVTYKTNNFYFGRNLDYDFSYGEEVVIMPRNFPIAYRKRKKQRNHYAIIGMATVIDDTPLFYDAMNEKGLCMAGLNFVGNARYNANADGKDNIAQFEFIPWILSQCANVNEAKVLLRRINITDTPFSPDLPVAEMHWMIADKDRAIVVEPVADGLKIYDNPIGVLTNNPPFPYQMQNLYNYRQITANNVKCTFAPGVDFPQYSRGMGAMGLPGDLSSMSRFVKVAFTKLNSLSGDGETESVSQFFHILGSVEQQRGCCHLGDSNYEITIYSSCCNADKGIYYYTTYDNRQICAVDMRAVELDAPRLYRYPISQKENILRIN